MIEKIGPVRNPLTIIAIFAGIAEISGTMVLPRISPENQGVFIWFLMVFPCILILLFFGTLNFNHRVLYAPSDFKDEDNFLKSLTKNNTVTSDKIKKLNEEALEYEKMEATVPKENKPVAGTRIIEKNQSANLLWYELLEEVALSKIRKEFPGDFIKNISFGKKERRYLFDAAIAQGNSSVVLIEMKLIGSISALTVLGKSIERIMVALSEKDHPYAPHVDRSILFVVITSSLDEEQRKEVEHFVFKKFSGFQLPVHVRIFDAHKLQDDAKKISEATNL